MYRENVVDQRSSHVKRWKQNATGQEVRRILLVFLSFNSPTYEIRQIRFFLACITSALSIVARNLSGMLPIASRI